MVVFFGMENTASFKHVQAIVERDEDGLSEEALNV